MSIHKLKGVDLNNLPKLGQDKKSKIGKDTKIGGKKLVAIDKNNPFDILETWDNEDDNDYDENKKGNLKSKSNWVVKNDTVIDVEEEEEEEEEEIITTGFYNKMERNGDTIEVYDYSFKCSEENNERYEEPESNIKLFLMNNLDKTYIKQKIVHEGTSDLKLSRNKFYNRYILPRKESTFEEDFGVVYDINDLDLDDQILYCQYLKISDSDMKDMGIHNNNLDEDSEISSYYDKYGNFIIKTDDDNSSDDTETDYDFFMDDTDEDIELS